MHGLRPSFSLHSVASPINRQRELDGLRGIAIIMVLLTHCFLFNPTGIITGLLYSAIRPMWLGVDLFFVLSGFLITRILLNSKGSSDYYRSFYWRRALRILPAYYTVLFFVLWIYPTFNSQLGQASLQREIPFLMLQMQNWSLVFNGWPEWTGISHFWSLSVEEQFYLVWPLLVAKLSGRKLARLCTILFVMSLLGRFILIGVRSDWWVLYATTVTHMDGLVAGAWVAVVTSGNTKFSPAYIRNVMWIGVVAALGLTLLSIGYRSVSIQSTFGMSLAITFASISSAALVLHIQQASLPPALSHLLCSPTLTWFGKYSYGIYLIHAVIIAQIGAWIRLVTAPWLSTSPNTQILLAGTLVVTVTCATAWAMYHLIERPLMEIGHRQPDLHGGWVGVRPR